MSGNAMMEYDLGIYVSDIEYVEDEIIVLAGSSFEDRLIVWNLTEQKRIASYIPYDVKHCIQYNPPWHKRGNSITYFYPNDARLFCLENEKLRVEWFLDCGRRTVLEKDLVPIGYGAFGYAPKMVSVTGFCETCDYALFAANCWELSESNFNIFYSKRTGQVRVLNNDMSKMARASVFLEYTSSDNRFVAVEDASVLSDWYPKMTKHFYECGKDSLASVVERKFSHILPTDNPVICLYKMNEF